jgi:hypothetical protein
MRARGEQSMAETIHQKPPESASPTLEEMAQGHTARDRFAERRLTVVLSCRQQGRPLLHFLVATSGAALRGSPPPSLLSAPEGGLNDFL